MSDEVPFIRKDFSDMVARIVYPAMKRAGLRRQGKRVWYDERPDSSWVLVEISVSDHTTRTNLEFTVQTTVWPPGTWAYQQTKHPVWAADKVPFIASNAPISVRPSQVRPDLWPGKDFVQVALGDDLEHTVTDLLEFLLAAAEWGRAHAAVEPALAYLIRPFDPQTNWRGSNYPMAIVMLLATQPDHPRLGELVETFTQEWRARPQPILLREEIQLWRIAAGLGRDESLPT